MNGRGAIWPLLIFAALTALLAVGLTRNPAALESPLVGQPAPAVHLPQLAVSADGLDGVALPPQGRAWLLTAWASWCGSCRQEHGLLSALARESAIPWVGLVVKDDLAESLAFLRQSGNPFYQLWWDEAGRASLDWGVVAVPETYVVDAQGIIRYKHTGPLTRAVWQAELLPRLMSGDK